MGWVYLTVVDSQGLERRESFQYFSDEDETLEWLEYLDFFHFSESKDSVKELSSCELLR